MEFSAVLLAGGKSSRMGRDKTRLMIDGVPLWRRQVETLRLSGASEVFVSGPQRGDCDVETIEDDEPGEGPLTGLIVSLRRARFPLLLVLAVDTPRMAPAYLRMLVSLARPGVGVVPRRGEFFEPLAASYPREALAVAEQCRKEGERALQFLASRLVDAGLAQPLDLSEDEAKFFANVNTPEDWDALEK